MSDERLCSGGIPYLIRPSEEQLQTIVGSSQIEYFPSQEENVRILNHSVKGVDMGERFFRLMVIKPLSKRIKWEYGNEITLDGLPLFGIRGTACSLGHTIHFGETIVMDIESMVKNGSETEGLDTVNLVWVNLAQNEDISGYPVQYAITYSRKLRDKLKGNGQEHSVFPAILLYDLTKLSGLSFSRGYEHGLPESPEERAKVIKRAFVLDYPRK